VGFDPLAERLVVVCPHPRLSPPQHNRTRLLLMANELSHGPVVTRYIATSRKLTRLTKHADKALGLALAHQTRAVKQARDSVHTVARRHHTTVQQYTHIIDHGHYPHRGLGISNCVGARPDMEAARAHLAEVEAAEAERVRAARANVMHWRKAATRLRRNGVTTLTLPPAPDTYTLAMFGDIADAA